ncbi:MAG: DUF4982 domain-containing protein [Lachnospiraceae bacterium]|nr:DUF4982 domain-containing protein [Lachnospiraceae bacterium]
MKKRNIDLEWEFMDGEKSQFPMIKNETRTVDLPHDFMIEMDVTEDSPNKAGMGFYPGGIGTYIKHIELNQDDILDEMYLNIEGCAGKASVFINGNPVGTHKYAYTPFDIDIRRFVKVGDNEIQILVNNSDCPNGRWYSGAGLYRGVNILTAPAFHIINDGLFVYTKRVDGSDAFAVAEMTVRNNQAKSTGATEGVIRLTVSEKDTGDVVATRFQKIMVMAGETQKVMQEFYVENVKLWDIDSPNMYSVTAELGIIDTNVLHMSVESRDEMFSKIEYIDSATVDTGFRTITCDVKNGLKLNGKTIKLKGGCIHHDNGLLGAASYYDAEYRKVKLHKENGYNALRLAHNPQSSHILDICDELGMIVYDEAFDVWNLPKNSYDFSNNFSSDAEAELRNMIRRDRNHPSIVFWSIGNELTEQGGMADGYKVSEQLTEIVRDMDSTRLVSGALCSFFKGLDNDDNDNFWKVFAEEASSFGSSVVNLDNSYGKKLWMEYTGPFASKWDVVGYNYLDYHYETSHEIYPDRVICCTESKPGQFEEYWGYVKKLPYVIGDFLWTSMDYIGEAGIGQCVYCKPEQVQQVSRMINYSGYPWRLAGAGDFDLCGFVKPQGAYHRIIWGSDETYIFTKNPANNGLIEIIGRYGWADGGHHWSWNCDDKAKTTVEVYSGADEVELLLNGKSLGRKPAGENNHYKACFEVEYFPGTLEAISYKDGNEISRDRVDTAGNVAKAKITLERDVIKADGKSLAYGYVELVDDKGIYVPTAQDVLAKCKVTGAGELVGFGNGRGKTVENYKSGSFTSYQGRWQFIVRAGQMAGEATVEISIDGVDKVETVIQVI